MFLRSFLRSRLVQIALFLVFGLFLWNACSPSNPKEEIGSSLNLSPVTARSTPYVVEPTTEKDPIPVPFVSGDRISGVASCGTDYAGKPAVTLESVWISSDSAVYTLDKRHCLVTTGPLWKQALRKASGSDVRPEDGSWIRVALLMPDGNFRAGWAPHGQVMAGQIDISAVES